MVIFIDETGIHKQTGHSTTAVVYVGIKDVEKVEKQILNIDKNLRIKGFHWAEHGWKIKEKFLKQIIKLDFFFKVAIFSNPTNPSRMMEIVFVHLITEEDIKSIKMLGVDQELGWSLDDNGLHIEVPKEKPCDHAVTFKISWN